MTKTNVLCFVPELAAVIGLNEAIVLNQIHYWIEKNRQQGLNLNDGRTWVFQTYKEWNEQFPFWSERTLERIFRSLEKSGYIIASCYNKRKYDRTKWYTIPYDNLPSSICQFVTQNVTIQAIDDTETVYPNRHNEPIAADELTEPIQENNKDNNTDENGLSPTHTFVSSSVKDDKRARLDEFIRLYYRYYEIYKWERHPALKDEQLERIRLVLTDFMEEYSVDFRRLELMMKQFFKGSVETDGNLNHFASEEVLKHRFFEAVYRRSPLLTDKDYEGT